MVTVKVLRGMVAMFLSSRLGFNIKAPLGHLAFGLCLEEMILLTSLDSGIVTVAATVDDLRQGLRSRIRPPSCGLDDGRQLYSIT